jgi:hypothetical protein
VSDTATASLDLIIEKYRRLPDVRFLLYEAYSDNGTADATIVFEVRNYTDADADIADIEPPIVAPGNAPASRAPASCTGTTTFTSQVRPGKKYAVVTGAEVAERAARIKTLLAAGMAQPPGSLPGGHTHLALETVPQAAAAPDTADIKDIDCPVVNDCPFRGNCAGNKKTKLTACREGGIAAKDIRALQRSLFKFGFGDEMFFEHYTEDGSYGSRTKLAVSHFISELNDIEHLALKPADGAYITAAVAGEMVKRCKAGWSRNPYYLLREPRWDIIYKEKITELEAHAVRNHVRQLQYDLVYFTLTRPQPNDPLQPFDQPLETLWQSGAFDPWTRQGVVQFQTAAAAGARYDPIEGRLVFGPCPTYTGGTLGNLDKATKEEIERWHAFVKSLSAGAELAVGDQGSWTADLSAIEILSPKLGCAALAKPGTTVRVLLGVPLNNGGIALTAEQIKTNLPFFLFLMKPLDPKKPFSVQRKVDSSFDTSYTVQSVDELTAAEKQQLYKGTEGLDYPGVVVDPSLETYWRTGMDDRHNDLYTNDFGNVARKEVFEKLIAVSYKTYKRKYKGAMDELAQKEKKAWNVTIRLADTLEPGMYNLAVRTSGSMFPHPVRVFPSDKTTYRVAHLTDIHLAARYDELPGHLGKAENYNNPNERLRYFFRKNTSADIDLVIITGDAIDYANNHRPYDLQKVDDKHMRPLLQPDQNWKLLYSVITTEPGTDIPVYIALGNHDFKHNPASVQYLLDDCNITQGQAERYPFDTQDTHTLREVVFKWWLHKCFGDTLFADENAVQFYFKMICPFYNFSFGIDSLNFIVMNTGPDKKVFIDDYTILHDFDETWTYVKGVLAHDNPAPTSAGVADENVAWLKEVLSFSRGKTNVLCLHNQLFNPHIPYAFLTEHPLPWGSGKGPCIADIAGWGCQDVAEQQGWYTPAVTQYLRALAGDSPRTWVPYSKQDFDFLDMKLQILRPLFNAVREYFTEYNFTLLEYQLQQIQNWIVIPEVVRTSESKILWLSEALESVVSNLDRLRELKDKNFDTSGFLKGFAELRGLVESGAIPVVLTGHIHTDMEARCKKNNGVARWHFDAFSMRPESLPLFTAQGNALVLSTVSTGVVGFHYVSDGPAPADFKIGDGPYHKFYAVAGYRVISFDDKGKLQSFERHDLYNARDHKRP